MKQKDIVLLVVIVVVSAILSLLFSKAIFSSPKSRDLQAATVQPISTDFPQPNSSYFNSSSFDPTQLITISQNNNANPFSSTSQ